ncbi:predicted protein [Naegleria gruberi]|uniref:Predicted protein n=1 Tax=Naegleria gruberi TaxID=5762 RepID=D2VXA6_NAEGR|nr:uncharacterized protein NAEGRDRAFT_73677 [Naegleria gruberi]EFC38594.1 predicted protein [Naegleria gruberi]|eukprot:XP_002671338.1 predicted protein [Naegleria gruberi strain NEG-M]
MSSDNLKSSTKKIEKLSLLRNISENYDNNMGADEGLGSADGYVSTVGSIDLFRTSPGMADLFRRLYQIRIDCGEVVDNNMDKQKQIEMQEFQKKLKKLDKFERQKVMVKQAIDQAESLLQQKKKQSGTDARLNNDINKAISKMDKEMKELDKIHQEALNKKLLWKEIQMPVELRKQRESDIKNFRDYIKFVKAEHKKLLTGMMDDDDDDIPRRDVKFESIDNLQKAKNEVPTVDISEGLEQIEQAKRQQEEKIDILLNQIQKIGGIANSISDELDKQAQLLDKMSSDVDKYNKQLDDTNKRMVEAIEKAGGATRLLIILIILIVIVALLGIGWLLLELFVPNLSTII